MIHDQDRSGWFGASDTATIMGNWSTKTFGKWWATKLGLETGHYTSPAMNAGTYYEGAVLDYIKAPRRDHQILLPELGLRVNLDGDGPGHIYEIKTHAEAKGFTLSKAYRQQVQVQIYAKWREDGRYPAAEIVSYGLEEADYRDFFRPVDPRRIRRHTVEYDPSFVSAYLDRLRYLKDCLDKGVWPNAAQFS